MSKSRESLFKFYGFAKRTILPKLKYSQEFYEEILERLIGQDINWLDLGCGHHLLPTWRFEQEKRLIGKAGNVVGLDFDFPSLLKHKTITKKVAATADFLPFKENYFDVVTANMVVEHLDKPQIQFNEINRVLKPNGIFVFHTPNEFGYFSLARKAVSGGTAKKLAKLLDGRDSDDVFEVHYKANNQSSIEKLAGETDFAVEKINYVSSDAVLALIPPLAVAELLWLKLLMLKSMRSMRTNLIVVLRKRS